MNKRLISAALLLITLLTVVSCSAGTNKNVTVNIEVDAEVFPNSDFNYNEVILIDERANAAACFASLLGKNGIEAEGISEGFITKIGEFSLEGNYSWMFYVNGELAEVGVTDYTPSEGDSITLLYTDWTKLF